MSSLKKYRRMNSSSVEFKRKLIMQVKKHPSIWKKCFKEKKVAWSMIEKEMGFLCTLKDLQAAWASLRTVYFRKIFIRTIERNFEAPKWIYFHDMTFLYDIVKENIQKKLGGISPPLFKPTHNPKVPQSFRCPCCLNGRSNSTPETSTIDLEIKQEDELTNSTTTASEISFRNNEEDIGSIDLESENSICYLDAKIKQNENQSCFLTNSPKPQQNETEISRKQTSSSPDFMKDKTYEVIEIMEDIETSYESPDLQLQPTIPLSMTNNHSFETTCHSQQESLSFGLQNSLEPIKPPSPGRNELLSSFIANDCLGDSSSVPALESRLMEQTKSPGPREITTNKVSMFSAQSDHPGAVYKIKEYTPFNLKANQLRAIERNKIIAAVKANPATYLDYSKKKSTEHNLAWDRVAKLVGTVPLFTIKNRWRILKIRYLKELVYERYSTGPEKPMWECFKQLEFLRPHMQKDINDIHHTRIKMQDTIRKRAEESSKVIKSLPRFKEPVIENQTNATSTIKNFSNIMTHKPQFHIGDKNVVAYVNANQKIEIANVETVKPNIELPKQIESPLVLDENTLPILQNRPVTVTAIQVLQSLDLTKDDDTDISKNRVEIPPQTQNLLKSIGFEEIKTNVHANEISKRLSSPPASSLTLDLTTDEATTEPATIGQNQKIQPHNSQNFFPPLDLRLNDDPSVIVSKPASKKNLTSKFQQAFVDELYNTNKVFPTFDLTTDEINDQNKNSSNINEIAITSKNQSEKDDENVICLDDDDSVGSFEEVIVYFEQENTN